MQTLSSQIEKADSTENTNTAVNRKAILLSAACVFVFALVCTLSFHFLADGPKRTLCFDARLYIFDTARITEFILSALHGKWHPELVTDSLFLTSILADGPAFPGFYGTLFALFGHVPDIKDCRAIEIIQSILHSFSATMIFALSFALTRRACPSILSGLCWAAYPAAIFWSGIFYTETIVIFSTLLFVSLLSSSKRLLVAVCAGVAAGVVALLKPALLPAAALSSLFSIRFSKKSLALVLLGIVLALSPWAIYTKMQTGQLKITAQRFPAFNLAMGADTEVDACFVSPAPPLTTMFSKDEEKPYAFPMAQWQFHTADCLRLAAVKLSSLWSRQANDFRQSFFLFNPSQQNLWHLFLLFSGITGILITLATIWKAAFSRPQQTIVVASLIFIGSHFCYVLFTPAARYGLTAMPFFIIFAAVAFKAIFDFMKLKRGGLPLGVCAPIAALLIITLVNAVTLSPVFQQKEIAYKLNDNDFAVKEIDLAAVKTPTPQSISSVLLLVDGDKQIENAEIEVNGHKAEGRLEHIRSFESELYQQSFELRSLGYPAGLAADDFRHWRALHVPVKWINWTGKNEIKIIQKTTAATIYADPANDRKMLAINYFSVNSLCNSDKSLDLRIPSPIKTAAVEETSFVNSSSPLSSSLRVKLAVALGSPWETAPQTGNDQVIAKSQLSSKDFDLYVQDPTVNGVRVNRINMKAARSTGCVTKLPNLSSSSWVRVRVEGDLRGKSQGKAEVVVALQPAKQSPALVLNMSPQHLAYNNEWQHFVIEDLVPTKLLAENKEHSLYLAVYPGPWLDFCGYTADKHCGDAQFRNLSFQIQAKDRPDLAFKRLLYY